MNNTIFALHQKKSGFPLHKLISWGWTKEIANICQQGDGRIYACLSMRCRHGKMLATGIPISCNYNPYIYEAIVMRSWWYKYILWFNFWSKLGKVKKNDLTWSKRILNIIIFNLGLTASITTLMISEYYSWCSLYLISNIPADKLSVCKSHRLLCEAPK